MVALKRQASGKLHQIAETAPRTRNVPGVSLFHEMIPFTTFPFTSVSRISLPA